MTTSLCLCIWCRIASFFANDLAAEAPSTVHQSGQPTTFFEVLLQSGAAAQPASTGWLTISKAFRSLSNSRFLQPEATAQAVRVPPNAAGRQRQQWGRHQSPGNDGGYPMMLPPGPKNSSKVQVQGATSGKPSSSGYKPRWTPCDSTSAQGPAFCGNGSASKLSAAFRPPRLRALFVSRLNPSITCEHVSDTVNSTMGPQSCVCTKLLTKHDSYFSFHVSVNENYFEKFRDAKL